MRALVVLALILTAGCGSHPTSPSPTPRPTPTPTPPPPTTITISGRITDTVTGAALGSFTQTVNALPAQVSVSAPGHLTRSTWVRTTTPTVDLIPDAAPFSLGFYRQLVRNGYEASGSLEPLRRQAVAPRIYIRTVDQAGAPIDTAVANGVERIVRTSGIIEAFSGGVFGLAGVEVGPSTREGVAGWITIRWQTGSPDAIGCGHGSIGGDWIELTNHPSCGGCPGALNTYPRLIKHEIGHAMGFWHTDDRNDVMYPQSTVDCDNNPSPRERYHAAIAYKRAPGNRDVDSDPVSSAVMTRVVVD